MSTQLMRVPVDVKEKVEELQTKFSEKTAYGAIERLIKSYESFERFRKDVEKKEADEKARQAAEFVHLGKETKERFANFLQEWGFRSHAAGLDFLIAHFEKSDKVDKSTLALYKNLR